MDFTGLQYLPTLWVTNLTAKVHAKNNRTSLITRSYSIDLCLSLLLSARRINAWIVKQYVITVHSQSPLVRQMNKIISVFFSAISCNPSQFYYIL